MTMTNYAITQIKGRYILDSRGVPTVEADVCTSSGWGRAAVPSGASTGEYEAHELRDNTDTYHGKGVKKAVENVNTHIFKLLKGEDVRNQQKIDQAMIELDGTENKSRLGANAILAVSLASARCAAACSKTPLHIYLNPEGITLPVPMFNIINGGEHAPNELDLQEYMVVPVGASCFSEAVRIGSEIYHELEFLLGGKQSLGDEGGFSPSLSQVHQPLDLIVKAAENRGYQDKIKLALDCAPSYFYDKREKKYVLEKKSLTASQLIEVYEELVKTYPIVSIEDPVYEDDMTGFQKVTEHLGNSVMLVGDDVFVTNPKRLKEGIEKNVCNALLLKVNQIGTLTEAVNAANLAFDGGYEVIVSHRSGETEDTFISHLAVALNCGWIKAGAPARGERTAKYNELLRIEEQLKDKAVYG